MARKTPGTEATIGRPTLFTPVLAERICTKVAEGMGIERIGELEDFPDASTIYRWMAKDGTEYDAFRERYARACELRAGARFEKLREIGDKLLEGKLDPQAARVAADIEKWSLAREAPKKYGDAMTLKGDKDNPLRLAKAVDLSEDELLLIAAGDKALDG